MKPVRLGNRSLSDEELLTDRKAAFRYGTCAAGEKALYLGGRVPGRMYYVPAASVGRCFKRIAMSKGGFTGKGIFGSIPYLVVVYDGNTEYQCRFRLEQDVDRFLERIRKMHPEIKTVSAAQEEATLRREQERRRKADMRRELSAEAGEAVRRLRGDRDYLYLRPELFRELSEASGRRRSSLISRGNYAYVALAACLAGLVSFIYGIISLVKHSGGFALYFVLFGFSAMFMFSGLACAPLGRSNKKAIYERYEAAKAAMDEYISGCPGFFLPARYAHPVCCEWMIRCILDGRASTAASALDVLKSDLRALNRDVEVDREEYEKVAAIKSMFLNEEYL